ncbi:MAG: hypothetical protein RSC90_11715, partial [Clostridia bacterium]
QMSEKKLKRENMSTPEKRYLIAEKDLGLIPTFRRQRTFCAATDPFRATNGFCAFFVLYCGHQRRGGI